LPESPAYFPKDAEINRTGAVALDQLTKPAALSPAEVQAAATRADGERCTLLDVRSAADFGVAHVPGSINIGLGGQFAIWAGSLVPIDTPLIIVAESEEKAEEAVVRLARVGHEGVCGYLDGGVAAWIGAGFPVQSVPQISVGELEQLIASEPALQILDVRRVPEYEAGHVPHAVTSPLMNLEKNAASLPLDPEKPTAVICAGGYRSSAATSLLQPRGFKNLLNVSGGTNAWIAAGYSVATE
jgi:rhodanese-related sulfurtransferase